MSVQSAMNQLLGSAGSLAYQITAPSRYAKAQEQSIKNVIETTRAKEETQAQVAQEQEKKAAGREVEVAETALEKAKELQGQAEAKKYPSSEAFLQAMTKSSGKTLEEAKTFRDKLRAAYEKDPSDEDIKQRYLAAEEELGDLEYASRIFSEINEYFGEAKRQAEADALDSIQTKTQGHTEQKNQLEQRIEMLKQLNQEGVMSNTQAKKYIHRIGGNQ